MIDWPPPEFDETFFAWLDRMTEELDVQFVSTGYLTQTDITRLEQQLGFSLPEDLRRYYARYSPWGILPDWAGWTIIEQRVREATGTRTPLVPVEHGSYNAWGSDTVAAVECPHRYQIIEYFRSTGKVRTYKSLRSYFIAYVLDEIRLSCEDGA